MSLLERLLEAANKDYNTTVDAARKPEVSKGENYFSSLPIELQLGIVRHLPRLSLPTVCRLNKYWHGLGTDELLRRLLAVPLERYGGFRPFWQMPHPWNSDSEDILFYCNRYRSALRDRAIRHFIRTNNVGALRRLLDFTAGHRYSHPPPYLYPPGASRLLNEPASLRARVTEGEEKWFFLFSCGGLYTDVV